MRSKERAQQILSGANETHDQITVSVKKPNTRYLDEFTQLKCSSDMLRLKLFPNAKEITESFAAYRAVRKFGWITIAPDRKDVLLVAVGDGAKPRTAATFAFRTAWRCLAIDPVCKWNPDSAEPGVRVIDRLDVLQKPIEDVDLVIKRETFRILVAVHSHADLSVAAQKIRPHMIVAMPCCYPQAIENRDPHVDYQDWGVWSPERTVRVWGPRPNPKGAGEPLLLRRSAPLTGQHLQPYTR